MTTHSVLLTQKELLGVIFRHLEIKDLGRAALVCKLWNRVANSDLIWKNLYFGFQPSSNLASPSPSPSPSPSLFDSPSSTPFPWKSVVRILTINSAFTITGVTSQGFSVKASAVGNLGGSLYAWEPIELDYETTTATTNTSTNNIEPEVYLFEMKVLKRHFAMAIGVVVVDEGAPLNSFPMDKDPEFQLDFYGYYYGGGGPFVWDAQRHWIGSQMNFAPGDQVGVLIDKTRRRLRLVSNGVISEESTALPTGVERGGKRRVPKEEGEKKGRVWVIPTIWAYQKGDEMFVFFPKSVKKKKRREEKERNENHRLTTAT